jgi:hypothetical protein
MSQLFRAALLSLLCLACIDAGAQPRPERVDLGGEARSFLWVGNSFFYYNNSMHGHVAALGRGMNPAVPLRGVSLTISGSGSDWHDIGCTWPDLIGRHLSSATTRSVTKPGRH